MDLYTLTTIRDGELCMQGVYRSAQARDSALRQLALEQVGMTDLPDDVESLDAMSLDDIHDWLAEDGLDVYRVTTTIAG